MLFYHHKLVSPHMTNILAACDPFKSFQHNGCQSYQLIAVAGISVPSFMRRYGVGHQPAREKLPFVQRGIKQPVESFYKDLCSDFNFAEWSSASHAVFDAFIFSGCTQSFQRGHPVQHHYKGDGAYFLYPRPSLRPHTA